ncbi:shikimate dehydrogenase family protein [Qipengyuania marisflavi]|uniref:Shikimate dehydrogenase (NADP(+)) n=1 Tax=Qipengyuania marisflavi TaxID=2486356 RepID=A0A5S3PAY8_9SPHN|nr:shikimate dehydrogenase [Qipengyuania marisflavi]TMM48208.1 shikimate dehydrogenase [Qipengyuania marisflavi]
MSVYAEVIGDPIAQSKSPSIHNFWLEKLGIDAAYRAKLVAPGDLAAYLAARRGDPDWSGCNVTMPHKQAVLPLLDRVEPLAKTVAAVNTITRLADGTLFGRNTDVEGFLEPLRSRLARQHYFRMARIIGTGGAARAVVAGLAAEGFTLVVAGRDPAKARALLDELAPQGEHHAAPLDHFAARTDFTFDDRSGCCDLVINASPLGMRGQPALAFDWSHAPPGSIAYDIVTDPVDTQFLRDAREAGFETIGGLAMLIGQAAAAFQHFFDIEAPREFDAMLKERLAP